jgi:hypothetical protein
VYQPLVPCNRVQAPKLQPFRWLYKNKLKLKWSNLLLRQNNLVLRQQILGNYTWSCYQTSVVYVVHLLAHPVPTKIRLLILQLLFSRWIVFKLVVFKFVINIWFLFYLFFFYSIYFNFPLKILNKLLTNYQRTKSVFGIVVTFVVVVWKKLFYKKYF